MIWFQAILMCYAMAEQTDTPIHKITIKPPPPTTAPHPMHANNFNVNRHRGRKIEIDPSPTIIKVLKKPPKKPNTILHRKKFEPNGNLTDENMIYFTRARVNGSFRQSVGRTRDAKELWHAFRIKPIPQTN